MRPDRLIVPAPEANLEAIADPGVPNVALAEYKAPGNYRVADCPLCQAGTPITRF